MHTTLRSPHRHTETKKFELIKWNEIWHARYLTVQFYELIFFLHVHSPKRHKIDCVQFAILSPQIYNVDNVCKTRSPQREHFPCNYVLLKMTMLDFMTLIVKNKWKKSWNWYSYISYKSQIRKKYYKCTSWLYPSR